MGQEHRASSSTLNNGPVRSGKNTTGSLLSAELTVDLDCIRRTGIDGSKRSKTPPPLVDDLDANSLTSFQRSLSPASDGRQSCPAFYRSRIHSRREEADQSVFMTILPLCFNLSKSQEGVAGRGNSRYPPKFGQNRQAASVVGVKSHDGTAGQGKLESKTD